MYLLLLTKPQTGLLKKIETGVQETKPQNIISNQRPSQRPDGTGLRSRADLIHNAQIKLGYTPFKAGSNSTPTPPYQRLQHDSGQGNIPHLHMYRYIYFA